MKKLLHKVLLKYNFLFVLEVLYWKVSFVLELYMTVSKNTLYVQIVSDIFVKMNQCFQSAVHRSQRSVQVLT